jgi:hypothetical protein
MTTSADDYFCSPIADAEIWMSMRSHRRFEREAAPAVPTRAQPHTARCEATYSRPEVSRRGPFGGRASDFSQKTETFMVHLHRRTSHSAAS